jgi:4'-phosphopantetheinyl transferase
MTLNDDGAGHRADWALSPSPLSFPTDHVDVWKVRLDAPVAYDLDQTILSADEVARATRFRFEQDRAHFVHCRSALRQLVSRYLVIAPGEIRFLYSANGKPQVEEMQNRSGLQFNVSHSGNLALIAFGGEHRLGVDIEMVRGGVNTEDLSQRFFSTREQVGLAELPENLRAFGFFACWTRKEALLKATGDGLSFPLADFSVSVDPRQVPKLQEIRGSAEAGEQWFLADIAADPGYFAALAIEKSESMIKTYSFEAPGQMTP